jgi:hypothetical protein
MGLIQLKIRVLERFLETYSYLSVASPNHATPSAVAIDDNIKIPWKIRGGRQTQSRAGLRNIIGRAPNYRRLVGQDYERQSLN